MKRLPCVSVAAMMSQASIVGFSTLLTARDSIVRVNHAQAVLPLNQGEHRRYLSELLVGGKCSPRVSPEISPQSHGGNTFCGYVGGRKTRLSAADVEKAVLGRLHKCHKTAFEPFERYTSSISLSLIINRNHCIVLVTTSLEAWPPLRCPPQ